MEIDKKHIGAALIVFSVLLLALLTFVKVNVDTQESYVCELTHAANAPIEQCPAHQSNNSWLLTIAFGIAFLFLAIGFFVFLSPARALPLARSSFKRVDLSELDEEEKEIYELLRQNQGSLYQSDLIKQTGFSKVRVSRVLDRMTSKGLIDRARRGMTNMVVLK